MLKTETQIIENKQSLAEWKEIVESIAAFATVKGGAVRVGISPGGQRVGVHIRNGMLEDIANKIKINTDPPQFPSINIEGSDDSAVITVHVEESPIRPVLAFGRAFKRVGNTNQHVSRGEVQRLMEISSGRYWDSLQCLGASLNDIDLESVRTFSAKANLPFSENMEIALKNLSLITSEGKICNGAMLLFGKNTQQFFPEAQIKCARFSGTASVEFLDEKTFYGNIFSQFEDAMAFVARNTRQALDIRQDGKRETVFEYPQKAAWEAIVNSLCHRDYAATGTVQIRIYDNRLEVWNPGMLPSDLTVETLFKEHQSHPRNPRIAGVFHRAHLIEHWGTGTLRIIRECQLHGIKPEFVSENGSFMVRFEKSQSVSLQLNPRQIKALRHVTANGNITNIKYQTLFKVSERQSLRELDTLVQKRLLLKAGKGRATHYIMFK